MSAEPLFAARPPGEIGVIYHLTPEQAADDRLDMVADTMRRAAREAADEALRSLDGRSWAVFVTAEADPTTMGADSAMGLQVTARATAALTALEDCKVGELAWRPVWAMFPPARQTVEVRVEMTTWRFEAVGPKLLRRTE